MSKDDPLSNEVSDRLSKHTLWLNTDNFEEMVQASFNGYRARPGEVEADYFLPTLDHWRAMCAAALAVVEWRMTGRVRP